MVGLGKILIIITYFGHWPEWFRLFLRSCDNNPNLDWLVVTDCPVPETKPTNINFLTMSFDEFIVFSNERLGVEFSFQNRYKLCMLRPAFNKLFREELAGYDFWGTGDVDLIYGDLEGYLNENGCLNHDIISFHDNYLSGHLFFVRNKLNFSPLSESINNYYELLDGDGYSYVDELYFDAVGQRGSASCFYIDTRKHGMSIWASEANTTPYSRNRRWPQSSGRYPDRFVWRSSKIVSDDCVELPYLHFMNLLRGGGTLLKEGKPHWGELEKVVYVDEARDGIVISSEGFWALGEKPRPHYRANALVRLLARKRRQLAFHKRMLLGRLK